MGNSNPDGVRFISKQLQDPTIDIYVHWDASSKVQLSQDLFNLNNVYVIKNPVSVSWGGFSQVQAQLKLLEDARAHARYDYFHLISDNDVALMSVRYLKKFFEENNGQEFVGFEAEDDSKFGWKSRFQYYYPFENLDIPRNLKKILEMLSILVEKAIGVNRLKHNDLETKKGSSWYSITNQTASYILSNSELIQKMFSKGAKVDEIFLQTLIWNSDVLKRKLNSGSEFEASLRYIDWNRGNPYSFSDSDIDEIRGIYNTNYAFLRKIQIEDQLNTKEFLLSHKNL